MAPLWTLFQRTARRGFDGEDLLSVYRDYGVVPRGFTADNWNRIPDDLTSYQLVEPGDLVLNKMKAWQGSLGVSALRGIVSPAYFVYKPIRANFEQRYLHHLLRSRPFIESYGRMSGGVRVDQWDLDPWAFSRIQIPLPPLLEQRAIADYLDLETALIDQLVEKQNALIKGLRERRAELRAHLVLARNQVTRRNTDYWFGSVPDEWTTPRVSHHYFVVLGRMINAATIQEEDVQLPYVAAGSIQPDELALDETRTLAVPSTEVEKYSLRAGDVLVVEGGAGYGRSNVLAEDLPGWVFQNHVARVRARTDQCEPRYLREVLEMCRLSGFFEANNRTATLPSLSRDVLGALRIPFPSLAEQREIADHLDRETAKIDELIAKAERHIELAKERRSALITAAVTGQIEVGVA